MKIVLALLCASVSALAAVEAEWGDSGILGPKYSEILSAMEKMQSEHSDLVQLIDYGKTPKGKPMRMLVVMKKDKRYRARPTILMTGSTHGNEFLNIEDRLPSELLSKSKTAGSVSNFLSQGGAFVFVPVVNPDGYDARTRENSHGVDLNRDWDVIPAGTKGFKEPETKALAKQLDALQAGKNPLTYRITVDYHCCVGALLHPWSYKKGKLPGDDAIKHAMVGDLARKELGIDTGTTGEILGYFPLGTTKDYYYSHYGALSFTYEGRYRAENKYLPQHVKWWEKMTSFLTQEFEGAILSMQKKKRHPFFHFAD